MTRAVSTLENKNYSVKPLNLLVDGKIPEDARVIVIAGPTKPVSQEEVKLLKEFTNKGGSLIVMEDPTALTSFGTESDPLAEMLSTDWGIHFDNDVVIDLNSAQPTIATATYYDASHPVTVNMNNLVSFYPFTRSLSVTDPANGATITPLVRTNERSWGETDFASLSQGGQVGRDNTETTGPLTLAVAGENPATKAVWLSLAPLNLPWTRSLTGLETVICSSIQWIGPPSRKTWPASPLKTPPKGHLILPRNSTGS